MSAFQYASMSPGTSEFPAKLGGHFLPLLNDSLDGARLTPALATLRSQFSDLVTALGQRYGQYSYPSLCAEQVVAALQRLELSFDA
jgi:hypothetical protein